MSDDNRCPSCGGQFDRRGVCFCKVKRQEREREEGIRKEARETDGHIDDDLIDDDLTRAMDEWPTFTVTREITHVLKWYGVKARNATEAIEDTRFIGAHHEDRMPCHSVSSVKEREGKEDSETEGL